MESLNNYAGLGEQEAQAMGDVLGRPTAMPYQTAPCDKSMVSLHWMQYLMKSFIVQLYVDLHVVFDECMRMYVHLIFIEAVDQYNIPRCVMGVY